MSPYTRNTDCRHTETGEESRERLRRCLVWDIRWWRENSAAIPDPEMQRIALTIAGGLERLLDTVLPEA